jgi:hypothetical protein|tara:strand:- start:8039 stop:8230 length:192 start_codon:yes stop_codon:yes gene_type:complete
MNQRLADDFRRGYEAFSRVEEKKSKRFGVCYHQVANPMRKNTTSAKEWQRGWNQAYVENLKTS